MIHDKRNPAIVRGDAESYAEYLERLREIVQKLEWQSDGHRMWYTHKNPYGCWICELLQVARLCLDQTELLVQSDTSARKTNRKRKRVNTTKS